MPPPRVSAPLVHTITALYKTFYKIGKKVPKRDRFGIHAHIETLCLDSLKLSIEAAFRTPKEKLVPLKKLQILIETLKRFVRVAHEIGIYGETVYLATEKNLQEISRMTTGWIKYVTHKESR